MLDAEDLQRLQDQEFLLAKKKIAEEVISILQSAEETLKKYIESSAFDWPEHAFLRAGKISRGENYRDLPFFILDYPRKFGKRASFSYRTMVWWGNEISFTLHLEGQDLDRFRSTLLAGVGNLPKVYLCVNEKTPWEYHFDPDNYRKVSSLSHKDIHRELQKDFCKLSFRHELSDIKKVPSLSAEYLNKYILLLSNHY